MAHYHTLIEAFRHVLNDPSNDYNIEYFQETEKLDKAFYDLVYDAIPKRPGSIERSKLPVYYSKDKQKVVNGVLAQIIEPVIEVDSGHNEQVDNLPSGRPEGSLQQDYMTREQVIQLINEKLATANIEPFSSIPDGYLINNLRALPPRIKLPDSKGREARSIASFSTSCDYRLHELFLQECTRKRYSQSELIDEILWNVFGYPRLSDEVYPPGSDTYETIRKVRARKLKRKI